MVHSAGHSAGRRSPAKGGHEPSPRSKHTRDCVCGRGLACIGMTQAFRLLGDPRCLYVELPRYKKDPPAYKYVFRNNLREAYLRHLSNGNSSVDLSQFESPKRRYVALHHFHPTVVRAFHENPLTSAQKHKVPVSITEHEMKELQLNLDDRDRILSMTGKPTGGYYFVPDYPVQRAHEDLKTLIRSERKAQDFSKKLQTLPSDRRHSDTKSDGRDSSSDVPTDIEISKGRHRKKSGTPTRKSRHRQRNALESVTARTAPIEKDVNMFDLKATPQRKESDKVTTSVSATDNDMDLDAIISKRASSGVGNFDDIWNETPSSQVANNQMRTEDSGKVHTKPVESDKISGDGQRQLLGQEQEATSMNLEGAHSENVAEERSPNVGKPQSDIVANGQKVKEESDEVDAKPLEYCKILSDEQPESHQQTQGPSPMQLEHNDSENVAEDKDSAVVKAQSEMLDVSYSITQQEATISKTKLGVLEETEGTMRQEAVGSESGAVEMTTEDRRHKLMKPEPTDHERDQSFDKTAPDEDITTKEEEDSKSAGHTKEVVLNDQTRLEEQAIQSTLIDKQQELDGQGKATVLGSPIENTMILGDETGQLTLPEEGPAEQRKNVEKPAIPSSQVTQSSKSGPESPESTTIDPAMELDADDQGAKTSEVVRDDTSGMDQQRTDAVLEHEAKTEGGRTIDDVQDASAATESLNEDEAKTDGERRTDDVQEVHAATEGVQVETEKAISIEQSADVGEDSAVDEENEVKRFTAVPATHPVMEVIDEAGGEEKAEDGATNTESQGLLTVKSTTSRSATEPEASLKKTTEELEDAPAIAKPIMLNHQLPGSDPTIRIQVHNDLIAWESKRRSNFSSQFEMARERWKGAREIIRDGVEEVRVAQRFVLGFSKAGILFAEAMKATCDDKFLDDQGNQVTNTFMQNRLFNQRRNQEYTIENSRDSSLDETVGQSMLLNSVLESQLELADEFLNNSEHIKENILAEFTELKKEIEEEAGELETVGDSIVAEMKRSEVEVKKIWDVFDAMVTGDLMEYSVHGSSLHGSENGSAHGGSMHSFSGHGFLTPRGDLDASIVSSVHSPLVKSTFKQLGGVEDGWLIEMYYRAAATYQRSVFDVGENELRNLSKKIVKLEDKRQRRLQQVMLSFAPRQRRLYLALPPHLAGVLDSLVGLRIDEDSLQSVIDDSIRGRSRDRLRRASQHKSSIMNRSRVITSQLDTEVEDIESEFGHPFHGKMAELAKILEIKPSGLGGIVNAPWKHALAVITWQGNIHLFELPELKAGTGMTTEEAFKSLCPSMDFDNPKSWVQGRKDDIIRGLTPYLTLNMAKCNFAISNIRRRQLDMVEEGAKTGASRLFNAKGQRQKRCTLRLPSESDAVEWMDLLEKTKLEFNKSNNGGAGDQKELSSRKPKIFKV